MVVQQYTNYELIAYTQESTTLGKALQNMD